MSANLDTTAQAERLMAAAATLEANGAPIANLPTTGLPGLDHAIKVLTSAGYRITRNVRYCGWDYVAPGIGRREGVHADELLQEAAKVAATTTEEATR